MGPPGNQGKQVFTEFFSWFWGTTVLDSAVTAAPLLWILDVSTVSALE